MTRTSESHKRVVARTYNTRQHSRQTNFSKNRPNDRVGELEKTPRIRNQPKDLKSKKLFSVEPLSSRRLLSTENNMEDLPRTSPNTGSGEVFYGFPQNLPVSEPQNVVTSGSRQNNTTNTATLNTTANTSKTETNPRVPQNGNRRQGEGKI